MESNDPIEIQAINRKYDKLLANQIEKERIMRFIIIQQQVLAGSIGSEVQK